MENAINWSKRATCHRKSVGGILVLEGRTIMSGFCGAPSGLPHCTDEGVGCLIQVRDGRESCMRTLHCEPAMISFAAKEGIAVDGSELYITLSPCYECAKLLINSGIKAVYYLEGYSGADGIKILEEAGIHCEQIDLNQTKE